MNPDDAQRMTEQLRDGIVARQPEPILVGAVECDEVYVVAGHKGHPDAVKKSRRGRRRRLKGARGRGTLDSEKAADFRMIQRGGAVVIRMLENVRQVTIRPLIERFIAPGTRVYTDEYDIYRRLPEWVSTIGRCATVGANTPAMTTATALRGPCPSTAEGSGRCCVRGCDPIGTPRKPRFLGRLMMQLPDLTKADFQT